MTSIVSLGHEQLEVFKSSPRPLASQNQMNSQPAVPCDTYRIGLSGFVFSETLNLTDTLVAHADIRGLAHET